MLDIKTYRRSFFIDDTSKIYIDGAADTIDHFGFNDVYIKCGEKLTISGTDREVARYYKSFSGAISVSAKDRRAILLPKSEIIRT